MNRFLWLLYGVGFAALVVDPVRAEAIASHASIGGQVWPLIQLWATTNLSLVLIWGPGFVWFLARERKPGDLALAAFIGPMMLSVLGLACWVMGGVHAPAHLARLGVIALYSCVGLGLRRYRSRLGTISNGIVLVLGMSLLLVGLAVSKANLSYAAPGELFRGSISRTLEVGGHSDSRIPYHTLQLVAHHLGPYAPETHDYFYPWSFASRGPLSGLLVAPIVLATGAQVPLGLPAEPWHPFDSQGFASYRIAMIVLASLAAWAVYAVAFELMGADWALLAASVALLAPFFVHEMYFTWPKLIDAAGVLTSFLLVRRSRAFAAGLMLGVAYLFHPSAFLAAPFLVPFFTRGKSPAALKAFLRDAAVFGTGLLLIAAAWQCVGFLGPERQPGQQGFVGYFFLADNRAATCTTWLQTRWDNIANTFIPFRLLFTDPSHESINSYYGPSDGWVHFGFLYWNTLPFALGLVAFSALVPGVLVSAWRRDRAALAAVIGPAVFLALYWGCACTGLMRHTGQWLFLSVIVYSVWCLRRARGRWRGIAVLLLTQPLILMARGLDVAWMAFGTALHDHLPLSGSGYCVNDWCSLVAAGLFLAALVGVLASVLPAAGGRILCAPAEGRQA